MSNIVSRFAFDFLNSLPIEVLFLNLDFTIFDANNQFLQMVGYKRSKIVKKKINFFSDFNITDKMIQEENFTTFYEATFTTKDKIELARLVKLKKLTVTLQESMKTFDLIVLVIQEPKTVSYQELMRDDFSHWMQESLAKVSLVLYSFETGQGPTPLLVINESELIGKENKTLALTKLGFYIMTAIGQGTRQPNGLFGPLPVSNKEKELRSLVYAVHIKDKSQKDPRSKGMRYCLIGIIYPKMIEEPLLNRQRIRAIITTAIKKKFLSQITKPVLQNILNELFFVKTTVKSKKGRSSRTRKKTGKTRKSRKIVETINQDLINLKLKATYNLGKQLQNTSSIYEAFDEIALFCESTLDWKLFAFFMVDKINDLLVLTTYRGYISIEADPNAVQIPINDHRSVAGHVARTRKMINIGDVTSPEVASFYMNVDDSVRSELTVPIIINDELLGIIDVESDTLNAFNEDDENLLLLIADISGRLLLQRQFELYAQELVRLSALIGESSTLQESCDIITKFAVKFLKLKFFAILYSGGEILEFITEYGYEWPQNVPPIIRKDDKGYLIAYAIQQKQPVFVDDVNTSELPYYRTKKEITSEYCIPILDEDGVVKLLVNVESERPLDKEELTRFKHLASHVKLVWKMFKHEYEEQK